MRVSDAVIEEKIEVFGQPGPYSEIGEIFLNALLDLKDARARIAELEAVNAAMVEAMKDVADRSGGQTNLADAIGEIYHYVANFLESPPPPVAEFRERIEADQRDAELLREMRKDKVNDEGYSAWILPIEEYERLQGDRGALKAENERLALQEKRLKATVESAWRVKEVPFEWEVWDTDCVVIGRGSTAFDAIDAAIKAQAESE